MHVAGGWIGAAEAILDPAEMAEPVPGLRQRAAHMPAPAFDDAPLQCRHRAERHQIAGGVVEFLAGQRLWLFFTGGFSLRDVEAIGVLNERVEASPAGPR